MNARQSNRAARRTKAKGLSRRGVASVLAMMFLIIFGSLVAAMAIASQGNVRTAATHQAVVVLGQVQELLVDTCHL